MKAKQVKDFDRLRIVFMNLEELSIKMIWIFQNKILTTGI